MSYTTGGQAEQFVCESMAENENSRELHDWIKNLAFNSIQFLKSSKRLFLDFYLNYKL